MKKISILALISAVAFLQSCVVSQKKFDELLGKKVRLEADFAESQDSLNSCKNSNNLNKQKIEALSELSKRLKNDSLSLADKLSRTQKLLDDQNDISNRLRKDYKDLLANASAESNKMSSNLAKKEQQLLDLEKSLQETKTQNDKLLTDLKDRERRVKELEAILRKKDSVVTALKDRVSDALLSFKDNGLSVNIKNGKVYVSLSEKLLFSSGSTQVDPKGADALKKLANVLKSNDDINVMVEGHTDDVPVAKGSATFSDNWDLSVLRATEIVRIMQKEGLNPKKIIPAGHAEFAPIAEGKTSESRQKNRRTEIILTPKLDELFKILEAN
jgi:chemotaxis protein MotB